MDNVKLPVAHLEKKTKKGERRKRGKHKKLAPEFLEVKKRGHTYSGNQRRQPDGGQLAE